MAHFPEGKTCQTLLTLTTSAVMQKNLWHLGRTEESVATERFRRLLGLIKVEISCDGSQPEKFRIMGCLHDDVSMM